MKRWLFILFFPGIISSFSGFKEEATVPVYETPAYPSVFNTRSEAWADSVLATLSLDEKIGQLFMVSAYPEKNSKHYEEVAELVSKYKVGGVIFFKSGPIRLANMSNYLQSLSTIPLLTSIDGEWGLSMRVDSTMRFPLQMQLGALKDNELIYQMGKAIGRQMKRLGIQINFAPVLDINNNPLNPVINMRSFGDNKKMVAEKAYEYMRGQQEMHVLAVGKHFPGHGDTKTDSHSDMPYIGFSRARLDSLELYPFRQLISKGIGGIMVGHLNVPALDPVSRRPTSLSPVVVNDFLREKIGFKGLIFTDGLNMQGITKYFKPGEASLKALLAGNDVLLCPEDVPWAIRLIKDAIEDDIICEQDIDAHVKRILQVKQWSGLDHCQYIDTTNLVKDLFSAEDELLNRKLTENSLTLLKNEKNIIPFKRLDTLKIASVFFGKTDKGVFQENLSLYAPFSQFNIEKDLSNEELSKLKDTLRNYNLIIVSLKQTNRYSFRTFNFSDQSIDFVKYLADSNNVILNLFASPYSISRISNIEKIKAVLIGYDDTKNPAEFVPQLLFGGISAKGHLPVNISTDFPYGFGIETGNPIRLKYSIPEDVGIDRQKLNPIDSIINDAIMKKALPGCQVLVAKQGVVIYRKSFGYFTYYNNVAVTNDALYDLASITKTIATTLVTMHLYEQKKIDLDKQLQFYLPDAKGTNKENIQLVDLMTHQAKLEPFIPFYTSITVNEKVRNLYFSPVAEKNKSVQVADSMYISKTYKDSIYKRIYRSKLLPEKEYKYSDLSFYFMQAVVENLTHHRLDFLADSIIYKRIGAITMCFNPMRKFSREIIVPTENDTVFRKQLVWGYVHDPGSALMGGVAGHAGLFSNSNDLAKVCQMLLFEGSYGGVEYFLKSTVDKFTSCQFCPENRRGLGFDKPEPNKTKESPVSKQASLQTFGHQGFTGTCYWVDPEENLIYIFLSNRVYPDAENKKLTTLGVRNKVMDVIYDALKK
jgi:beta-N-acetylhexosaminidase